MERETLEQLIDEGLSIRKIAERVGLGYSTIRHWLKKYDLETKLAPRPYECKRCGETNPNNFYVMGRGTKPMHSLCKNCFNQDRIEYFKTTRTKSLEYLGGKCVLCGFDEYEEVLDIHHLDPSKKDENFSRYRGWTWERITAELDGCVLLCKNCHATLHAGYICLVENIIKP